MCELFFYSLNCPKNKQMTEKTLYHCCKRQKHTRGERLTCVVVNRNANDFILSVIRASSKCRFSSFTQCADSYNLLFHFMSHWYQHHQSAPLLQKDGYSFGSFSLFIPIDGTSCELSAHRGTFLVTTTFRLEWSDRMEGLQSLSEILITHCMLCHILKMEMSLHFFPPLDYFTLVWYPVEPTKKGWAFSVISVSEHSPSLLFSK